jgi:hypothetical protein
MKVMLLQPWKVKRPSQKKTMAILRSTNPNMFNTNNIWNIALYDYEEGANERTSFLLGDVTHQIITWVIRC